MTNPELQQETEPKKDENSSQSLFAWIRSKVKPGNAVGALLVIGFTYWFIVEPSYEPLLGILTGITALLSFNITKNELADWVLVILLVVVGVGGVLIVRRENDPEEIVIEGIFYDGVKDQEADEYVIIHNIDNKAIQLEGWMLHDNQSNHVFTFPRYEMQPDEVCRIYTNEDHLDWCGFNFRVGGSGVWNNTGGDMATLRNAEGLMIDSSIDLILTPEGEAVQPTAEQEPEPTPTVDENVLVTGKIVITTVFYDGEKGNEEPDEYVEIRNEEGEAIQLNGWTLSDEANKVFPFPIFTIEAGQICRIYTNEDHPEWCGFNYGKSAIWNNGGDCAILKDGAGNTISESCYPEE